MSRMLIITRGLPASGKSTVALDWVNEEPLRRARVNRDEMRQAMYGSYGPLEYRQEQAVTEAQRAAVRALLESGKGVIVDDTNLRLKYARAWADLAHELAAVFSVIEVETPVDQCVEWNQARADAGGRFVPEGVIRRMASQFNGQRLPVTPTPGGAKDKKEFVPEPWTPTKGLPWVWLFDLDGTLAHNDGHRGWFEYEKVGADKPWPEVVAVAEALMADGHRLLFLSGRSETCREQTKGWLCEHVGVTATGENLIMRKAGDHRADDVVKAELFDEHIRGKCNVHAVVDDRPRVARMWRKMGHRVLQCGDPHIEF